MRSEMRGQESARWAAHAGRRVRAYLGLLRLELDATDVLNGLLNARDGGLHLAGRSVGLVQLGLEGSQLLLKAALCLFVLHCGLAALPQVNKLAVGTG